jgi:hypothetical protein
MSRRNDCLIATTRELKLAGCQYEIRQAGRHLKVHVPILGQSIVVPASSSDWRAPRNARSFVRRRLRQSGKLGLT